MRWLSKRHRGAGGGSAPEVRRRLERAGLGDYADRLEQLMRPSIRLRPEAIEEAELTLGGSRLGGRPDLPRSVRWPTFKEVPQSFIAQINLAEINRYDRDGLLPSSGLLSFFYDSEQSAWGFDPADHGAWAVLHSHADADLHRHDFPDGLSDDGRFRPMRLVPEAEQTFAPWESSEVDELGLNREQSFAYAEILDGEDPQIHRLLGHPDPIQGDMQLECQLVSHGLYCGNASAYNDPRAEDLRPGAVDWRLLLQIDSEDGSGMMWGDVGRLYYWMHQSALRDRSWNTAWLILQCS